MSLEVWGTTAYIIYCGSDDPRVYMVATPSWSNQPEGTILEELTAKPATYGRFIYLICINLPYNFRENALEVRG
jgi:hypothetical protein